MISVGPESISIQELELLTGAFLVAIGDRTLIISMARMDDRAADWPYKGWPYRATRM